MTAIIKASILKKLQKLEQVIRMLEMEKATPLEEFLENTEKQFAVMHALVLGIEVVTDVGNYLLANEFNKSADTYEKIIGSLKNVGVISTELFENSKGMTGFRNLLIHVYEDVEPERVFEYLQKAPEQFRQYARSFQKYL